MSEAPVPNWIAMSPLTRVAAGARIDAQTSPADVLAHRLNRVVGDGLRSLRDVQLPTGSHAIDQIVVGASGVFVVKALLREGCPRITVDHHNPGVPVLAVGQELCEGVLDEVACDVHDVRWLLDDPTVPVQGIVCVFGAHWPIAGGVLTVRDVDVVWPNRLVAMVAEQVPSPIDIDAVHTALRGVVLPSIGNLPATSSSTSVGPVATPRTVR